MKKEEARVWFWFVVGVLAILIAIMMAIKFYTHWQFNVAASACAGCLMVFSAFTVWLGWTQVPEMEEWIIEFFGKYLCTWKAGLHIRFPYFGFMRIRETAFMGEQRMSLFMDNNQPDTYGGGNVDFVDGTAPVKAAVYFHVRDSKKATYSIDNVIAAIDNKMDACIRSYLGRYTIDEVNQLKAHFDLARILNGEVISAFGSAVEEKKDPTNTELYRQLLNDWGIEIQVIAIADIVLDENIIRARARILDAEKHAQAALLQKQATITQAEAESATKRIVAEGQKQATILDAEAQKQALALKGEGLALQADGQKQATILDAEAQKQALILKGEGLASQVEKLVAQGISIAQITAFLQKMEQWNKVGDKTVILEGDGGIVGLGAKLGAGFQSANSDAKEVSNGH